MVTSFTQQKLIMADLRKKKKLKGACEKKNFETTLSNSHNCQAWKMGKKKEGRK